MTTDAASLPSPAGAETVFPPVDTSTVSVPTTVLPSKPINSTVAFTCGVLLAMCIRDRSRGPIELWQRRILLAEIAVAAAVGFIPSGHMLNIAANVMISFLCALQYEAFRKVSGKAFASTMCTGNLRSGSECLYQAITAGDRAKRRDAAHYFGIILVFIAGAAIGVLVTNLLSEAAVFAAVLPLAVAFVCLR